MILANYTDTTIADVQGLHMMHKTTVRDCAVLSFNILLTSLVTGVRDADDGEPVPKNILT